MFVISDANAVNKAYESCHVNRSWKNIIEGIYPNVVFDSDGYALSPYDGYVCSKSNRVFHAGEKLPVSRHFFVDKPIDDNVMPEITAIDIHGKEYRWSKGSANQLASAFKEAMYQNSVIDINKSSHVGIAGKRITISGYIWNVLNRKFVVYHPYSGRRVDKRIFHLIRDDLGNVFLHTGTSSLGSVRDRINITARVVEHTVVDGTKQNVIDYPKPAHKELV